MKHDSEYRKEENIWWSQDDWKEKLESDKANKLGLKPFVLKMVDRSGFACCKCHWTERCSGCLFEPSNERIDRFVAKSHIVIEWHSLMIDNDYLQSSNLVVKHRSTKNSSTNIERGDD